MNGDLKYSPDWGGRRVPGTTIVRAVARVKRWLGILGYATSLVLVGLVSEHHGRKLGGASAAARSPAAASASRQRRDQVVTADQAMDRSEPVFTALMGSEGWTEMDASLFLGKRPGGAGVRIWQVECRSENGSAMANLMWNGQTGELRSASCDFEQSMRRVSLPLSFGEAEVQARGWLDSLTGGASFRKWQPVGVPQHSPNHWDFSYRSATRQALVEIGDRTGALLLFRQRPLSVLQPVQ